MTAAAVARPARAASGVAFVTPAVLAVAVWVYLPLLATAALSLTSWDLTTGPPRFVGAANYVALLTGPGFAAAFGRTVLLVLLLLPFATVVPVALAVALWWRPGRAAERYRAMLFLPMVLAPVATAISWRFVLDPLQGVANEALGLVGLGPVNWLGDPRTALAAVAAVTAGRVVGLNVLLVLAALEGIDRRTVAAARVDRATTGEIVRHLILPHLTRTTSLLAGICAVLAGQWAFTNVAVLTQGGPVGATDNVYWWIYTTGFPFFDTGRASAAAVVLVAVLGAPLMAHALVVRRRRVTP